MMKDIKVHDEGHQSKYQNRQNLLCMQRMNVIKNFCIAIDSLIFVGVEGLYIPRVTRVSVPSSELASPAPCPPSGVCSPSPPPQAPRGGGNTRLRAEEPIRTTGEKALHSVYSVIVGVMSGWTWRFLSMR
jgi:hypothetical protein